MEETNQIIPQFNDSLIIDSSNIVEEYLEIGIDTVLENETLREIPIVKSLIGTAKIIKNINERNVLKNLVIFLNELNSGNINKDKLINHRKKLNSNSKFAEKELGRILIILNQIIDNEKSCLLGKLYKAYVNQKINWELFCEYSEILNRLFIQDLKVMRLIYDGKLDNTSNYNEMFRVERLNSIGIIGLTPKTIMIGTHNSRTDSYINLNSTGHLFASIIFE